MNAVLGLVEVVDIDGDRYDFASVASLQLGCKNRLQGGIAATMTQLARHFQTATGRAAGGPS